MRTLHAEVKVISAAVTATPGTFTLKAVVLQGSIPQGVALALRDGADVIFLDWCTQGAGNVCNMQAMNVYVKQIVGKTFMVEEC